MKKLGIGAEAQFWAGPRRGWMPWCTSPATTCAHVYPPGWAEAALRAVEEIRAHVREARCPVVPKAGLPGRMPPR